jgi:hypothetical protein
MELTEAQLGGAYPTEQAPEQARRLRRYTFGVTTVLIVLCNALLLLGI